MRRFFSIFIWTILVTALIVALILLGQKHDAETSCEDLELVIDYQGEDALIEEAAIRKMIIERTDTLAGKALKEELLSASK